MLKSIINLLIISLVYVLFGFTPEKPQAVANVHQDPAITLLLEKHLLINKQYPKTNGYRVQIFSVSGANSRDRANLVKAEFLTKYPDAKVYIVYHAPSYKVRIGDYRTKLEAMKYIQSIKGDYPFAFAAVDEIELVGSR